MPDQKTSYNDGAGVTTATTLDQLQTALNLLFSVATREQSMIASVNASKDAWVEAGQGIYDAVTELPHSTAQVMTSWTDEAASLFGKASERSTQSLAAAHGTIVGADRGPSGGSGVINALTSLAENINRTGEQAGLIKQDADQQIQFARDYAANAINEPGAAMVATEDDIANEYVDRIRPIVARLGTALDLLGTIYDGTGQQVASAASQLKWDGPGAGNTAGPGGGPGNPAAAGPAGAGAGGGAGGPDGAAGGPGGAAGGPGGAEGGLGEAAGGPGGAAGGPGGAAGGPGGAPAGPADPVGGPGGAGGPGGTELTRLPPGGLPNLPNGGLPNVPMPTLPNNGLPLPPSGGIPLPPLGSGLGSNGSGLVGNKAKLPPLPLPGKGGPAGGGLGGGGLGGSAGLGGLRGGGGASGLGKGGAELGDQMIPRAGEQVAAPNQAGVGRGPAGSGSAYGTTPAGTAGGQASGGSPMMPPMGGAAGAGGGGGRGGKPGAGAIRPVNRKRKAQEDETPGVPIGLRGKAGRDFPGAFPMLPVNNRRRKDERDQPIETIQLLDEELWKVEEAEAVETQKRIGRLAT
jgi:hypothetical protein